MLSGKHALATMTKYRFRPVVVDHRKSAVAHYGPITNLDAQDVQAARAEVDHLPLDSAHNCLQILDREGNVVSHRMLNPENGDDDWK
jgi:hypothetical protein